MDGGHMIGDIGGYRIGPLRRSSGGGVAVDGFQSGPDGGRQVVLWLSARADDDDEWRDRATRYAELHHQGLLVGLDAIFLAIDPASWAALGEAREVLGAPEVRCLVTEATEGLDLLESASLESDPRRVLAGLASIAFALDELHRDAAGARSAHGNVQPSNVLVTSDGHMTLAVPPADLWLDDWSPAYRAVELAGSSVSPDGDRFAFTAMVHRCITGHEPARGQVSPVPGACEVDPLDRPTCLFEWITGIAGSTIAPETSGALTSPLPPSSSGRSRRWAVLLLALGLAIGLGIGWLLASSDGGGTAGGVVGALDCDPRGAADAAERFLEDSGTEFAWTDSDDDCHHDAYEIHWLGTDYRIPDTGVNGERASPDMQIRVLVNFFEDLSAVRDVNPGKCEPERVAEAADRYIERAGLLVTWVDTDDDCLHDIWESNAMGSDPGDPDTDGDGILDSLDPKQGSGALLVPIDEQVLFIVDVHRRNHLDAAAVEPTDPSLCDPDAWARAAGIYVALAYSTPEWIDPDGDCVHSVYETDVMLTDPDSADSDGDGLSDGNDPDSGDGMIPPIDRQYDYVITVSG